MTGFQCGGTCITRGSCTARRPCTLRRAVRQLAGRCSPPGPGMPQPATLPPLCCSPRAGQGCGGAASIHRAGAWPARGERAEVAGWGVCARARTPRPWCVGGRCSRALPAHPAGDLGPSKRCAGGKVHADSVPDQALDAAGRQGHQGAHHRRGRQNSQVAWRGSVHAGLCRRCSLGHGVSAGRGWRRCGAGAIGRRSCRGWPSKLQPPPLTRSPLPRPPLPRQADVRRESPGPVQHDRCRQVCRPGAAADRRRFWV